MTSKTDALIGRAIEWARADPDVAGLVLYGSAAKGKTHDTSDVDLIVVAHLGRRDQLWNARAAIADRLLTAPVAWSHELPHQGPFRYQAWRDDLLAIDLTIDDGCIESHDTLVTGQPTVIEGDLVLPAAPVVDHPVHLPPDLSVETWIWILGIHNQLRQGRIWASYCQLVQLLDSRVSRYVGHDELVALTPEAAEAVAITASLRRLATALERLADPIERLPAPGLVQSIQASLSRTHHQASSSEQPSER